MGQPIRVVLENAPVIDAEICKYRLRISKNVVGYFKLQMDANFILKMLASVSGTNQHYFVDQFIAGEWILINHEQGKVAA